MSNKRTRIMTHINYFEPYESKQAHHEDQLTRAFMVVLRYVPSALMMFYDSVIGAINEKASEKEIKIDLLSISQIDLKNLHFETQIQNIDETFETNTIISVLITDEQFDAQGQVTESDRGARYDGVIYFSSDVAFIIENKPSRGNVWEQQLSPSAESLPDDVEIIPIASIIEWKNIIKNLNRLKNNNLLCRAEKEIISDFLDFIDENFPTLNPYDSFTDCKNNLELLNRRVKNILEASIVNDKDIINYHTGWGCHYISCKKSLPEIWMIGFPIKKVDENDWKLIIEMWFGDTLSQSRELYKNNIDCSKISTLKNDGWEYGPDFHISFMQKHLVWLGTPEKNRNKYLAYWANNTTIMKQYSTPELCELLEKLKDDQIIEINSDNEREIEKKITGTNRDKFYISPGFGLTFSLSSNKVKELDSQNKLADEIKDKIRSGLSILAKDIDFIK